jgi:DNA-binding SARP family transcriptional activator/tetratricopeptide (TPR) repeat protein
LDGQPVEGLNSYHLRALLAYLAVDSRRVHSREQVASLLWSERPDREALSALRYALSNLHYALADRWAPAPFLLVTRTHVQFNPASDHWLDVAEFQDLRDSSDVADLERAAALYRGPFLDGFSLADSPVFEEWMLLKGEEIQRNLLLLLDRLTALQMSRRETGEAARWARRQLELEPYREQAHRQLMRALALGGERSTALAHYEACRRLLAKELGCEPEDETQALYAQIRDGALPQPQLTPLILSESPQLALPGTRMGPAASGSVFRFVARQGELSKLGSLLGQALAGRGSVALISGEAGSGKTALLEEFSRQAGQAHADLIALRGRCSAHGGAGDPYLPFREILQTLAGDVESKRAGGTLSPEGARRVWEALPIVGAALVEHGPDLIDSFVPGEALMQRVESFVNPAGVARWHKKLREILARAPESALASQPDLFAQLTQVLYTLSMRAPLLVAIDDLQWADSGTEALLFHLGRRLAGSRILLVCACRPQEHGAAQADQVAKPGFSPGIRAVLQELSRQWGDILVDLDQADGWAFVDAYVDSEPNRLDADFRHRLYDHTGGNPLFTVELLHSFERQGMLVQDEAGRWIETPGVDWTYCPPQVEAVIAGHLADLPDDDQALLQTAAVQGEQFVAEVVAQVLVWDEEAVVRRLSGPLRNRHRLVDAVSLERLASSGRRLSHYRFRHVLLQHSAYDGLDEVRRPQLHEATGRALEAVYATEAEKPQGLATALARHYEAAGLHLAAARLLHDAGHQAMRLSAFRQALDLFDHGLTLLADEPPSSEHREIERLLGAARLGPLHNLGGAGGVELASGLRQATAVGAGDATGRPRLLMLLSEGQLLVSQGQLEKSLAKATQMLDLATQWGDMNFIGFAHWQTGFIFTLMGKLQEAQKQFDWVLNWITPEREVELRTVIGFGVAAQALSFSAIGLWLLGYPEQARARCIQAVTDAIERGDPYGQAFALVSDCNVLFLVRIDETALQERSELSYQLCLQQGFVMWQPYMEVLFGWLAVMQGEDLASIDRIQRAIAGWQVKGMAIGMPFLTTVLVDGCLAVARRINASGDTAGAKERNRLLATGLEAIELLIGPEIPFGQNFQPELYRLKGELLLERNGLAAAGEALECFGQSMQISREQKALAWELRAAISLVRLRQRQGEACAAELVEARQLLMDLYASFTEGFNFPDLQEAAALIGKTG